MLTEEELIELLRSQLDKAERDIEQLSDLLREAYAEIRTSTDLRDQIEEIFSDLDVDL
tara:strand:- start:2813 stop:2986 length:174 start_codon:yes stop_codon:yes gene_type:complete